MYLKKDKKLLQNVTGVRKCDKNLFQILTIIKK